METQYLEKLELPAVLNRLAQHTSFSSGKALALALTPATNLEHVQQRQQQTHEARALLDLKPDLTLGGAHDLLPFVQNALRGLRLLPPDLLNIRDTLRRAGILRRSLVGSTEQFPLVAFVARGLSSCPDLISEIERCIGERGEVLDRASAELGRIRAELGIARERLMEKLNRILANPDHSSHIQEAYVTQRDGRFVIPVRADAKSRIPGLVHDQSASGATYFVEPLATVELNNRWRELELAQEREVERILLVLSGLVADEAEAIQETVQALAQLDLIFARAKYAEAIDATMPEMVPFAEPKSGDKKERVPHPGSTIDLRQARHPLLDPKTVVPIDVKLEDDAFVVVLTGPNTGGKTVSLKTVGLLALMAQCGLHLPVGEGSRLSVFDLICADIGDEQSIEQSLSTFSSHMTHIIHMLETVDEHALVLLDELGAGTDPVEGAALAQSLLTHLLQRRVTTLATTHYAELKMYAYQTPGVVNASVEFDVETLAPTYHLSIGLPGQSNAFAIAQRLGLPEPIVRRARSLLSSSHLDAERFLADIKETRAKTVEAHAETEARRAKAETLSEELHERLSNIDRERQQILNQAREQAAEELERVRRKVREVRRHLAVLTASPQEIDELEAELDKLEPRPPKPPPIVSPSPASRKGEIQEGDTVWVPGVNATGEVLEVDDETAEVQVGAFRVHTRLADLELRHKAAKPAPGDAEKISLPPTPDVNMELHLRGMRVNEALPELERYLDSAYRAQVPFVRIIHGKGTGTLRKAVRNYLSSYPLVESYRDGEHGEGDTGVTIARFART